MCVINKQNKQTNKQTDRQIDRLREYYQSGMLALLSPPMFCEEQTVSKIERCRYTKDIRADRHIHTHILHISLSPSIISLDSLDSPLRRSLLLVPSCCSAPYHCYGLARGFLDKLVLVLRFRGRCTFPLFLHLRSLHATISKRGKEFKSRR